MCLGTSRQRQARRPASITCRAGATLERGVINSTRKYRFHSKQGALVDVRVDGAGSGKLDVLISVSYANAPAAMPSDLQLHWGMFRASPRKWHHPKDTIPPGSTLEPGGGGAMRSPLTWDASSSCWLGRLSVPEKLAPLHLGFSLYLAARDEYDTPLYALSFCVPIGMSAGTPAPLGVSATSVQGRGRDAVCSVNFAMFSRHATAVQLCLVRVEQQLAPGSGRAGPAYKAQNVLEVSLDPLTNRSGEVWHICVHGLKDIGSLCWAWRADGEVLWQNGNRYHPGFMLLDPYATRAVPVLLPDGAHKAAPRMALNQSPDQPVVLGSLAALTQPPFPWKGLQAPARPGVGNGATRVVSAEAGVVLEVDVVQFTSGGPEVEALVPPERRGTYLGVLDRLDQIKASGASIVVLGPVMMGPMALTAPGTDTPYRLPLALFAPDPALAVASPLAAADELKALVQGLHAAGLDVLFEVEFCLTAEGGDASAGRLQGLRGIDHAVYYRDGVSEPVLNCGHPIVRRLVVDCLRHWAAEYCCEGFVFANAENLTQDKFGAVLDNPPLAEEIAYDPVLRNLRLVASVSNQQLLPRGGDRGFPHWGIWQEVNDRYRRDMWQYLASGQKGLLSAVATRLTGSADLFQHRWDAGLPGGLAAARRPSSGINALGPLGDVHLATLLDPAGADPVRAEALARLLLLTQFTSSGQPLVPGVMLARPQTVQLLAALAAIRRYYKDVICPPAFDQPSRELTWHSAFGPDIEPDWSGTNPSPAANVLLLSMRAAGLPAAAGAGVGAPPKASGVGPVSMAAPAVPVGPQRMLVLALNPGYEPVNVPLPRPPAGMCWRLLVDSMRPLPRASGAAEGKAALGSILSGAEQDNYSLAACSGALLDAVPVQQGGPVSGVQQAPRYPGLHPGGLA